VRERQACEENGKDDRQYPGYVAKPISHDINFILRLPFGELKIVKL
jgi:hypothetical protein